MLDGRRSRQSSFGSEAMTRLQKLLAGAGHGSRRSIEQWIRAGRLTLNGRTAQLGDRASADDDIRLDGRPLELDATALQAASEHAEVLLYHKPTGEVTTRRDPQGRPTAFEHLPPARAGRWIVIGRLDVNTSGLLLFTTDGELAHRLMHPSSEVEREYLVRVRGNPSREQLRALTEGVTLEDGPARFEVLRTVRAEGAHHWYTVVLREGRNREVRRLWAAVGCEVSRLKRTRYGPIELPASLKAGAARLAAPAELAQLRAAVARG